MRIWKASGEVLLPSEGHRICAVAVPGQYATTDQGSYLGHDPTRITAYFFEVSAWYSCSARTVRPSVFERANRVHGRGGAGQRRDAGHAVHHREPAHGAIVEERLAAERRVDDQLDRGC